MPNFEVDMAFTNHVYETVVLNDVEAADVQFEAMNSIRDRYADATNVEVLEVREV